VGYFTNLNKAADELTERAMAMLSNDGKSLFDICEENTRALNEFLKSRGTEFTAPLPCVAEV